MDTVATLNISIAVLYFLIFLLSNVMISCHYQDQVQNMFQNCLQIKTITVSLVSALAFTSVILFAKFSNTSDLPTETIQYQMYALVILLLLIYTIKEREFTFPFIKRLLRCGNTNAVGPGDQAQGDIQLQELNPAALPPEVRRVTGEEDDGGIFVG